MSEASQLSVVARLTESEARYRAVIENASDMIQSVRPDGSFEFVNKAWHDKLGYSPEELEHMTVWDIIHPDSIEHCMALFQQASQGQSIDHVEAVFVTRSGDPVPVEGNATVRMADGQMIATHSFFRDVSERLRTAELEERNAQLEREQFARYLEKMAALGKLSAGLAHELNNPAAAAQRASDNIALCIQRRDDATRRLTNANLNADQWRFLAALVGAETRSDRGSLDDDPLALSEREETLEEWLEHHDIFETWKLGSDLACIGVTDADLDDLESRLPAGTIEPALRWITETYELRDLARIVSRSTHRISELVESVKRYTYMDRAAEQLVDIHDGIESTLIILAHRLKNITVRREYDRSAPPVRAFGSGLNQVWTNIIDNAADATGETGTIQVRTSHDSLSVVVEIEDDGCGIPREHLTRIFEPFFTTKAQGHGTGLGLDMAWRIVTEEHQGTIDVESEPGSTVFRVTLPVAGSMGAGTD